MKTLESKRPFQPQSPDASGVISWVHLGDLHMTKAGEQNHLDLAEIVNEVNRAFAGSVSVRLSALEMSPTTAAVPPMDVVRGGLALDAWPEHGLLGTQLGPNKNGKKW